MAKEKEFLKALWQVLNEEPVLPLGKRLDAALEPAVSLYCDGRFTKARSAALKTLKSREKKSDAASGRIVQNAKYLLQRIDVGAEELLNRMQKARHNIQGIPFVRAFKQLSRGFKGSEVAKKAKALDKEAARDKEFAKELKAAREWLSLLEKYPVLFPIEKSSGTQSFAGKLKKFVDKHQGLLPADEAKKVLNRFG